MNANRPGSLLLVFRAYLKLIAFDRYLCLGDFPTVYQKVHTCTIRENARNFDAVSRICSAVDLASIWYWKRVPCLQRSAATTCLLREQGVPATLVLGTQHLPFKAHAWVEVQGRVVNDKPYVTEKYQRLDCC